MIIKFLSIEQKKTEKLKQWHIKWPTAEWVWPVLWNKLWFMMIQYITNIKIWIWLGNSAF
jgi:hypothetical protein